MRWLTNYNDLGFKWTATAAIWIHPTKTWLSQLVNFKNVTWILEERYAIKFYFILGKNANRWNLDLLLWPSDQGSSGRDSVGRCQHSSNWLGGISTRTMHQSTTPSLSQTIWPSWASRQFSILPIVQTLFPVTFCYSLSSEAVVMRQLRGWKRLGRRSLTRSHKRISMGPSRRCWNGTTSALQSEEITSKGTRVSCVYYQ